MGMLIDGIKEIAKGLVKVVKGLFSLAKVTLKALAEVLKKFWAVLLNWFNKAIKWVEESFNKFVLGAETFLKKVGDAYQELSYHYSQNDAGTWERDTVIKQKFVSEDEIPDDIKALAAQMNDGQMINVSQNTGEQAQIAASKLSA
jgi:hypothetical protein